MKSNITHSTKYSIVISEKGRLIRFYQPKHQQRGESWAPLNHLNMMGLLHGYAYKTFLTRCTCETIEDDDGFSRSNKLMSGCGPRFQRGGI